MSHRCHLKYRWSNEKTLGSFALFIGDIQRLRDHVALHRVEAVKLSLLFAVLAHTTETLIDCPTAERFDKDKNVLHKGP